MSHSIYFKIFNRFLNTLLSRICHLYSWAQWLDVCDRKRSHSIHANDKTLIIYLLKRISRYSVYNIPKSTMWSTENTSIIPRKRFGVSLGVGPCALLRSMRLLTEWKWQLLHPSTAELPDDSGICALLLPSTRKMSVNFCQISRICRISILY